MVVRELLVRWGFVIQDAKLKALDHMLDQTKKRAMDAGNGIGGLADKVKGLVAAYAGFQAASGFLGFLTQTNVEFQGLMASLEVAEGSAAGAEKAFAKIQKFAATTPYGLNEVTEAYIKLKNLGLEPSEEALKAYGNTASSMVKPIMQMIEAVADASTGEFERLKEFGIKAKQQGDTVSFTFRGVTKTVKKNSKAIEGYLKGIGLNEFAGAMDRKAKTIEGRWSNLQDNIAALARSVGKGGFTSALEYALDKVMGLTVGGEKGAEALGRKLGGAIRWLTDTIMWWISAGRQAITMLGGLGNVARILGVILGLIAANQVGLFVVALWNAAAALKAVGAAGLIAQAGALALPLAIGAAIAGVVLIVQDFVTWMNGGDALFAGWFQFWYDFPNPIAEAVYFAVEQIYRLPEAFNGGLAGMSAWLMAWVTGTMAIVGGWVSYVVGAFFRLVPGAAAVFGAMGGVVSGFFGMLQAKASQAVAWVGAQLLKIPQYAAQALGALGPLGQAMAGMMGGGNPLAGVTPGASVGQRSTAINSASSNVRIGAVNVTAPPGASRPGDFGTAAAGGVAGAVGNPWGKVARNANTAVAY